MPGDHDPLRALGCLAAIAWIATSIHAVPPIVQLPPPAACVTAGGTPGCTVGKALDVTFRVAISPDGRNVYVTSQLSDAIAVFDRNVATGALTQKADPDGCVSETGAGGCADGIALDGIQGIAISPDGRSVYATANLSNSVLIYDRGVSRGELLFKPDVSGCVSEDGTGAECQDGFALNLPYSVAVSVDGRNVYVASAGSNAVAVFDRDPAGELTQKPGMDGCVSEGGAGGCAPGVALNGASAVALSPDGENVYVVARVADALVILDRDPDTGELMQKVGTSGCVSETGTGGDCVNGVALDFAGDAAASVTVSPDGRNVYVATKTSDAVAVFDRNLATGELTQKPGLQACISLTGTGGSCTQGVGLADAEFVGVSPDGKSVYVSGNLESTVAVFDRNLSTGALTQKSGLAACVGLFGVPSCEIAVALANPNGLAISPDARHVYVAAGASDSVVAFTRDVPAYDIDGDGEFVPLTDGLLLLRRLFGFGGATLVTGAVDLADCTRCTAASIEAYIDALLGP